MASSIYRVNGNVANARFNPNGKFNVNENWNPNLPNHNRGGLLQRKYLVRRILLIFSILQAFYQFLGGAVGVEGIFYCRVLVCLLLGE